MEQRTLMTMHKVLHPREDIDRLKGQEKNEEESPVLKVASLYRYDHTN